MSSISLESLTKVYWTGVTALDSLSLDVAAGEFVVLVGPSGCGKTTALRMVAGLETITSGVLRFGDQAVNDVSPRQRDVAMVFQNYALYPHLSVAQNIGFALTNKGLPRPEIAQRVRSAADVLGLSDLLNRRPSRLSGGQRQRVAMARAIVREPAVFLMDEPLSNLDAKLRVQMRSEVLRVHRSVGAATLYVTHDQTEAMTMGDRVAVLRDGKLQQYGAPRELYARPANLFVATFIGSPPMNVYEAAVEEGGVLALGSQRISLTGPVTATGTTGPAGTGTAGTGLGGYHGRKVVVGIRPEDLVLDGTGAATSSLAADVRLVEMLGDEQHVYLTLDATPAAAAADSALSAEDSSGVLGSSAPNGIARLDARTPIRPGDRIRFAIDPARLHFFDPDTGTAIHPPT
jgi:multiple sugar transport system ATP-binding protein